MQQDINDIGKLSTTSEKFASSAYKLPVGQKYHLIKSHFAPPINYQFPTRFLHQCRRGFQSRYLSEYSWMVYSPSVDGVFCKHCALMTPMHCRKDKGAFVNKPFINWHKLQEKAKRHEQMKYHHDAMIATESFLNSVENPEQNVNNRIDDERRKNVIRNRHIVKCVSEAILFCGRQCIALRGDNEVLNEDSCGNTGNFLAALQMIANHDNILKQHLDNIQLSSRNISYLSPLIQNEIIEIIGQDIILKNLLEEIKAAKLYSVMADEVTSHNKEQLALCARFIDKSNDVREEFIAFIHLPRITGEVIAETIVSTLQGRGLKIENIWGTMVPLTCPATTWGFSVE